MTKKIVRLAESDLHKLIKESVIKILKEGSTTDTGVPEAWENLKEMVGSDAMLDAIWNYADSDTLKNYVDWMIGDFDLNPGEVYGKYHDESDDELADVSDGLDYEEDPDYPSF